MRVTRRKIEKAIFDKYGINVEVVHGDGYWYFSPEDSWVLGAMTGTSVYTYHMNGASWMTVDWWLQQFEELFDGTGRYPDGSPPTTLIKLTKRIY